MYSDKVMKIFKSPKNYGKMKNPDAVGTAGNPICGDVLRVYIKIGKNKDGDEFIKDVKFETFGCVAAISVASALTEIAKGKTLEEALKIDNEEILKALGGLPDIKVHCSLLGEQALKQAIGNYRKNG